METIEIIKEAKDDIKSDIKSDIKETKAKRKLFNIKLDRLSVQIIISAIILFAAFSIKHADFKMYPTLQNIFNNEIRRNISFDEINYDFENNMIIQVFKQFGKSDIVPNKPRIMKFIGFCKAW